MNMLLFHLNSLLRIRLLLPLLLGGLYLFPALAQDKNSCLDCHGALDPPLRVASDQFSNDVHSQKGLSCVSCHGGDASSEEMDRAMAASAGFRGKIRRNQIPALCGSCHSDAAYMRQFNPSLRTDQLSQYKTSVHGKRLLNGDSKVAVCTDCHSVHDILPARDARATVHPLKVADTCSRCHANADYMKGYPISTDQFAGYNAGVHHHALILRGDLSAPTCTTCHGNHGAAPPGVASVEFVCSTCHVFQAQLFDTSPHKAAFSAMGLPACVTCHGNHKIERPTDSLIGTGAESSCVKCHSAGDPGYQAAEQMHEQLKRLEQSLARSDAILDRAEHSGMEVSQARLDQTQGEDALTKARVTIHSFRLGRLEEDIKSGLATSEKVYQAGVAALAERDYRRKGLAVSLVSVIAVIIGLVLYIRRLESSRRVRDT